MDFVKHGVGRVVDHVVDTVEAGGKVLDEWKEEKLKLLKEFEEEKKRWVASFVKEKMEFVFDWAMMKMLVETKDKMHDPYMPGCVYDMVCDFLDLMWPDVKIEVKDTLLAVMRGKQEFHHGEPPCCKYSPLAVIRYAFLPYDRNIWRKIRHPIWWIITILFLIPVYSVAPITFTLYFLLLDHRDEFQLLEFILHFKAMQFLNLGIISAMVASVQFYICVTDNNCEDTAPSEKVWSMGIFIWQVILVWIAFILLKWSKAKGGQYYQFSHTYVDETPDELTLEEAVLADNYAETAEVENEYARAASRTRLLKFLIYDFIVFLLCIALAIWLAFDNRMDEDAEVTKSDDKENNWKFTSGLFLIKALYGVLSFPFVILKIPGLSTVISHSRPTGYNPYGNTVPYVGFEETHPVPWELNRKTDEEHEKEKEEASKIRKKDLKKKAAEREAKLKEKRLKNHPAAPTSPDKRGRTEPIFDAPMSRKESR